MSFLQQDEFPMRLEREAGMMESIPMVAVGFGLHPIEDGKKTKTVGHPIFVDKVFVRIAVPGDRNSLIFQPADENHKRRFPLAWADYQKRSAGEELTEGLRLEMWPAIQRSQVLNLRAAHIQTVEALSQVHDGNIDKLGTGMRALRDKARTYLETAKNSAAAMALADRNAHLEGQIKALQEQMKAMQAQMNSHQETRLAYDEPISHTIPPDVAGARNRTGRSPKA